MGIKRIFEATEYKNMRELIETSAEKFGDRIAFTIKKKDGKKVEYDNRTYKDLLEDVNEFGTGI